MAPLINCRLDNERLELLHREADKKTLLWREENFVSHNEKILVLGEFSLVYAAIKKVLDDEANPALLWAKPTFFDVAFFKAYCHDYGLPTPWYYRNVIDCTSFMFGLGKSKSVIEELVKKEFDISPASLHRALMDCAFQIACVQTAIQMAQRG